MMKARNAALAVASVWRYYNPVALVHPSAYSQGQCALFCFTKQIDGPEFASLPPIAQARYRQEVRHLHQLFHVSTK
jgi:hypothetical protein